MLLSNCLDPLPLSAIEKTDPLFEATPNSIIAALSGENKKDRW
tara:strand:- start:100 stop:228 length:129 start_codon:yes stop_codon:yes gene_type:complete